MEGALPSASTLDTLFLDARFCLSPSYPCFLGTGLWPDRDSAAPPACKPIGRLLCLKRPRWQQLLIYRVFYSVRFIHSLLQIIYLELINLRSFSDGIIFLTPKYNGSFSSDLKNFIDVFAKEGFLGKPIGVATGSTGAMGGVRAANQLQQVILSLFAYPQPVPFENGIRVGIGRGKPSCLPRARI
jgi:hypothetical protein